MMLCVCWMSDRKSEGGGGSIYYLTSMGELSRSPEAKRKEKKYDETKGEGWFESMGSLLDTDDI